RAKRQHRGNINLAKVVRVEPSLQAAFVEYGGNRHGFLACSEIHPDYYQIPVADREAIMAEAPSEDDEHDEHARENDDESEGGMAEEERLKRRLMRRYKIQDVIKRRQVMLVQVVKDERGGKGAALTTWLSLAGRYCVLMPNTGKGGGISRKITNTEDRKRLKEIAGELEVPEGMGLILRTAGASRTKVEIKRDYEYLMRMWESVRELTLASISPALVYEEGNLVKRSIRDLYNKDIDEVHVAGDEAYREAKDFMRMLMPSHAKSVKAYREQTPLFASFGIESQLDAMFSNTVTLKSGGYIVINQTEALVAIDINSGRSTREHNIEDTALKTNLEAAEEISRQLRLRDLAGLIVIDFIDMEENRNNRAVEKKLKDCLKDDRARIQVGRISAFGLLEMSRQRIRTGVLESSSVPCPHCAGAGMMRSVSSVSLQILRALEETLIKSASHNLNVRTRPEVALYVLNQKRAHLADLETRFNIAVTISTDATLLGTRYFEVERGEFVGNEGRIVPSSLKAEAIVSDIDEDALDAAAEAEALDAENAPVEAEAVATEGGSREDKAEGERGEGGRKRRRRRRRRRGGERDANGVRLDGGSDEADGGDDEGDEDGDEPSAEDVSEGGVTASEPAAASAEPVAEVVAEEKPKRARRGRKPKGEAEQPLESAAETVTAEAPVAEAEAAPAEAEKPKRSRSRKKVVPITEGGEAAEPAAVAVEPEAAAPAPVEAAPAAEPEPAAPPAPRVIEEPVAVVLTPPDPDRPKRGGWWNKLAGRG
ncbi:ribonuclease E/G, partial [Bosea sp. (in: a-proteobacteria)]|uniref:Rne/Rng family ribonuclease n=1 Tax=Bosea sp. (in: a-proteobacteria) TaxID=1871050 RepID=UPI002736047E